MARIALAEIPGVGQVAAPVMANYQEFKTPKVNYAGGANALQQGQISERAFNAPGQALEQVGYATSKAAGVFGELAGRLQDGQNYADIAKAESVMEQARADHAMEAAQLPAEERMKLWETSYRPKVDQQIAGMGLSAYARERVDPHWATFDAKTRTNIAYDAYKDKAEENKGILLGDSERKFLAGDFEGSNAALYSARKSNLISEQEFQSRLIENEKRSRDNMLAARVSADPDGLIQDIEGGKIALPEIEQQRLVVRAKQQKRENVNDASDALDDMVLAGKVPDREFIQKYGEENGLSVRQILSHVSSFEKITDNTPEGQARAMDSRSKILTAIEGYDPMADVDLKQYGEIGMMIRALPEGLREDMRAELRQKKKDGMSSDSDANHGVFSSIDKLGIGGALGPLRKSASDTKDDPKLAIAVSRKEAELKSEFKKWRKANPKATIEQSYEWLNGMVKPDVLKNVKVQAHFPRTNPPETSTVNDIFPGFAP